MQVPIVFVIQDDGWGISVPTKYQTTKGSISEVLSGFESNKKGEGVDIYTVKAWDYNALNQVFDTAAKAARTKHIPCVIHVTECTQGNGHSTSGSHERYKPKDRLAWEKEMDCLRFLQQIQQAYPQDTAITAIQTELKHFTKGTLSDFSHTAKAAINIPAVPVQYGDNSPLVNGYEVLNNYFDQLFERNDKVYAFGEDVGKIGGVNQCFAGLQEKYGIDRVFDTGIREWTIVGQGIGMAMRGLRPIAEIVVMGSKWLP